MPARIENFQSLSFPFEGAGKSPVQAVVYSNMNVRFIILYSPLINLFPSLVQNGRIRIDPV